MNQSKQTFGQEQMLPANHCPHLQAWTAVKHHWALTVDQAERTALLTDADQVPRNRALRSFPWVRFDRLNVQHAASV